MSSYWFIWSLLISKYLLNCKHKNNSIQHRATILEWTRKLSRLFTFTSGSKFLKTYILVFSITANKSGLSLAHFISQTSLRSSLSCSPITCCPVLLMTRASKSKKVKTPERSMIATRLQNRGEKTNKQNKGVIKGQLSNTTQSCTSEISFLNWHTQAKFPSKPTPRFQQDACDFQWSVQQRETRNMEKRPSSPSGSGPGLYWPVPVFYPALWRCFVLQIKNLVKHRFSFWLNCFLGIT